MTLPLRSHRNHVRRLLIGLVATAITVVAAGVAAPFAQADPAPAGSTVSAAVLPTWQINGVVWSQAVVGNTVYVTGSFTKARPPGVAVGGPGEIDANNVFAFDITTGNPVTYFNHSFDAQGLVVRAAPDGKTVYFGGDFTTVDGSCARPRRRLRHPTTGALLQLGAQNRRPGARLRVHRQHRVRGRQLPLERTARSRIRARRVRHRHRAP